jgi:hypothetical protein
MVGGWRLERGRGEEARKREGRGGKEAEGTQWLLIYSCAFFSRWDRCDGGWQVKDSFRPATTGGETGDDRVVSQYSTANSK